MTSRGATLVAYVPTPHAGYLKLFRKYKGGTLYIIGREFLKDFQPVVRHIPGNEPEDVQRMVQALGVFSDIHVLTKKNLIELTSLEQVIMPDEDVSHSVAKHHFGRLEVMYEPVFLRWTWTESTHKRTPQGISAVTVAELDRELMGEALKEAQKSPDWWRQIGALLVRDKHVLLRTHNTHMPSEHSAYLSGDPRSNFGPGEHIDVSLALHAEMGILATAAKRGISTLGCDLYSSTFPCPPCANAIAQSGIKRIFFSGGYSLVAGQASLSSRGVEIIRVDLNPALAPA